MCHSYMQQMKHKIRCIGFNINAHDYHNNCLDISKINIHVLVMFMTFINVCICYKNDLCIHCKNCVVRW